MVAEEMVTPELPTLEITGGVVSGGVERETEIAGGCEVSGSILDFTVMVSRAGVEPR